MTTLKELLDPIYKDVLTSNEERDVELTLRGLYNLMDKGLIIPKYSFNDRVYFLHNNRVDSGSIEGYEITQTRDTQTIMYCLQELDFNIIEGDLFKSREALIESLK